MLRSSFARTAIRRYATAPPPASKPALDKSTSDAFLQNLLDKVKTIKDQPAGSPPNFVKKNSMDRGQSKFNSNNNNSRRYANGGGYNTKNLNGNNNRGSFNRSSNGNNNSRNNNARDNNNKRFNNNNNNHSNNGTSKFSPPQQQFSKAEYAQQRRAKVEKKFGSADQVNVFDSSSRNAKFNNSRARKPASSIFAANTGARVSPTKKTRRKFNQVKDGKTDNSKSVEEIYSPEVPRLPDLIKYSSNLAFSPESRMTRALFQVLQGHYQFPDLYSDKVDLLDHGFSVIPQQPLTAYPYHEKHPLSNSKLMGPTIVNADFDFELLNKTIEKTVFGRFEDLKINVTDDKLKLNAQVVQNSLNRNIFFNYSGRKERIYKSCAGLASVQSLTE